MTAELEPESHFDDLLRALARTPEVTRVQRKLKPGTTLAGRFQVEEQLGQGGMGRVFKAYDKRRAIRVALKMLGMITPETVLQLKNEFRNAAELTHPNLVQLHELYFDGVEWLISMDLIEGVTLHHLHAHSPIERPRLIYIFQQLALAICELHRLGILHGDLKPSNFLITSEDRVVVLDFGLARPLADASDRYARSGTPGYMAPEQESGLQLSAAADWYSFGVVLGEALLGTAGHTDTEKLAALSGHEPLAQLSLALQESDPQRRPQPDAVLRAFGLELPYSSRLSERPQIELVGRTAELSALHAGFEEMLSSTAPTTLLVQGASGIGKTTLVEKFVCEVRERGALVLSGRCRERESIGYKAVDVLIDDLVSRLQKMPKAEADVVIPSGIADLTRLFPALRTLDAISLAPAATPHTLDQSLARSRAIDAFTELLSNLAARSPLVIWIDDLQWGDAESAPLLASLLARGPGTPVMFVASLRSLGAGRPCALLDALFGPTAEIELSTNKVIELQPLSAADSTSLALRLLPPNASDTSSIAASIAADAAGHPLFLTELARATGTYAVQERSLTLSVLMTRRIAALPEDARALLQTMALAGAPLSRTVAHKAKGFPPERVERALDVLRSHRLLRSDGLQDDDDLDVLHDRIREIIVMALDEPTRRRQHLELAHGLAAQPSARPDLIATHFEAAGAEASAQQYWVQPAERAAESLAFQRAAELFRHATNSTQVSSEQRQALLLREADMLALAGRGADAARLYLATSAEHRGHRQLDLKRLAAEQLLHVGHLEQGVMLADEVLRGFGLTPIPRGAAQIVALMLGRLRVRLRGYGFTPRTEDELTAEERSRIDAAWTVASSLGIIDPLSGAVLQSSHLVLALDAGEPNRVLRALSLEASYIAGLAGHHARTLHVMGLVERLATQVDDRSARGRVALLRALGDYSDGNVALARQNFEFALESFATHYAGGVFFETLTAKRFLVASLFYLGRFHELTRRLPVLLAEVLSQGNLYAATTFRTHFGTIAWLALDDVAEARRQLALAREEWTSTSFAVPLCARFIAETYISLYTGEFTEAWQRVRDFWPTIVATRVLHIRLLKIQLWYLRAACALGAAQASQAEGNQTAAAALRKQARAAARRVRGLRSQLAEPLGELLLACVEMDDGDTQRARARLVRCIDVMDRDGLELFGAVARLRLARLDPQARVELERCAQSVFERERVVNSASIQRMLAPG